MVLDTKNGLRPMPQSLDRLVVQVDPVDDHIGRHGGRIHGESVVLGRDLNPARLQVLDRLIATAMAKLEFECPSTKCLAENLVSETDAKHRNSRVHQRSNLTHDATESGGIARSIGEKKVGTGGPLPRGYAPEPPAP